MILPVSVYDDHAEFYLRFVDDHPNRALAGIVVSHVVERLAGARVLDIACGEGFLARMLSGAAAGEVVGIDLSAALIDEARRRTHDERVSFAVDDAHTLASIADDSIDVAVSHMAMMDIVDHRAMFGAVARVLKPGGAFVLAFLHPCFQSPFRLPDEPHMLDDGAIVVRRYAEEGHWFSGGTGMRGTFGAHHRMLSTYVNDLLAAGFRLERLEEHTIWTRPVPDTIMLAAIRE